MALTTHPLPFGLRNVQLFPTNAAGVRTASASVKLPATRTLSFTEAVDSEDLEAEDIIYTSHEKTLHAEWDLEGGGVSFAVIKVLVGGGITATGTTPNQMNTYTKLTTDVRPTFDIEGQAISDSGGDFHVVIYNCKADGDLQIQLDQGSFALTACSGKGYGHPTSKKLYDLVQNETTTAIAPS